MIEHRLAQVVDLLKALVAEVRNLRHEVSQQNTTRGQHEELDPKAADQTGNTETGAAERRIKEAITIAMAIGSIVSPKSETPTLTQTKE
jgi:hypothetical protein